MALHLEQLEPRLMMGAGPVTTWTDGVATVAVYDVIGADDVNAASIAVKFGNPGVVSSVTVSGYDMQEGLGIAITGATSVGSIKDGRKGALGDLAFVVSNAPVKSIRINGDISGFNLNGASLGGIAFVADIDGDGVTTDRTAFWAAIAIGKIKLGGNADGDIWIAAADAKGMALNSFSAGGDLLGDLVAVAGNVGKVTLGGILAAGSNVRVGGTLKSLRATNYALDNGGTGYGLAAASYGKITFTEPGFKLGEGDVPYQDNDFFIADGDDQISEAHAIPVGVTIKGYSVGSGNDVDMFSFTVGAGQTVGFDIDCPYSTDTYIRLFDAAGNQLGNNDDGTAPGESDDHWASYMEYTFATGGTYYLGVSGLSNTIYDPIDGTGDYPGSIGNYTLTLTAFA